MLKETSTLFGKLSWKHPKNFRLLLTNQQLQRALTSIRTVVSVLHNTVHLAFFVGLRKAISSWSKFVNSIIHTSLQAKPVDVYRNNLFQKLTDEGYTSPKLLSKICAIVPGVLLVNGRASLGSDHFTSEVAGGCLIFIKIYISRRHICSSLLRRRSFSSSRNPPQRTLDMRYHPTSQPLFRSSRNDQWRLKHQLC